MIAQLLAAAALAFVACDTCEHGYASRYDPGVMAATVAARQEWGHLPLDLSGYDGFVAVLDCGRIGDDVDVLLGGEWRRVIVADCAVRDDSDGARSWMELNRILLELDWNLAESIGFVHLGAVPVVVRWEP